MFYAKAKLQDGKLVITESKEIDRSELTSKCWLIQLNGLNACRNCELLNTSDCGGKRIRKVLLNR